LLGFKIIFFASVL